jgi:glutaminase
MNLGLEELYRRHLPLHDDEIVGYYDTGLGYSKPERSAEAEQEFFAICLATTDDEVFYAGDHDRPFALQALSKVFVYGLALEAHGCDRVLV